jgi:CheY-like chemotaxis protein/anti-sigma regulatory factor (Ser/Thr protein kinase)
MNGVIGMAEILVNSALPPEQHDCAVTIADSARLQLAILNDILDSAKIESGRLELEHGCFSPERLLRDVHSAFRSAAAAKQLRFDLNTRNLPELVIGDSLRLRQVLTNIVSNAIKFTDQGMVTIEAAAKETDPQTIKFVVTDTGIGIPVEVQGNVFDPFTQADRSTTRRYGGTGLGLSISSKLVKLMHGSIDLSSTPGQGSRFSVSIRFDPAEASRGHAEAVIPEEPVIVHAPVLVVEDNLTNQRVAAAMLRNLSIPFEIVTNGMEAVDICSQRHFSLILMDCQMPVMDGFEAARRIRELYGPSTPIVALTAAVAAADRSRVLAAGMDDLLSKPLSLSVLRATLRKYASASIAVSPLPI